MGVAVKRVRLKSVLACEDKHCGLSVCFEFCENMDRGEENDFV